ncbi:Neutrophil gelatinase-associated lipocalin [Tupaia chinensis]|uniref:Neutrophil gelatinase-associated lipocalin n=1 Tax=Tupaia chinensis TaxID=246437 RepID=L9KH31_TUPCH|nr:Neutrophil gelatinase-associated lipocalin [Tupaia chinensis]
MSLGLLWLGLTLLGALQTQAQDSSSNLIPAPPLLRVPLQPDFQDDQLHDDLGLQPQHSLRGAAMTEGCGLSAPLPTGLPGEAEASGVGAVLSIPTDGM